MRNYEGDIREVEIFGKTYKAFFPVEHSNVEAIVYDARNLNTRDPWANIPNYYLEAFVKEKGGKWERLYEGPLCDAPQDLRRDRHGLSGVLHELEDPSVRRRNDLEDARDDANAKIARLKEVAKDAQRQLIALERHRKKG
jgi:hypothetical protein